MSSDNNWASYLDDGEEAYQKNPFQPGSSEPPTELKFFMFSDPAETRTADNKKLVRSHVARTSHAKSRHARNSKRGQAQPRNQAALEGSANDMALLSCLGERSQYEQYLLDHYTNVIIPNRHNPCSHPKHSIDVGTYRRGMTGPWVSLCLSDPGLMQGIYLASCQDLATKHRKTGTMKEAEFYEERALQYRGECLRSMYEAMPSDGEPVTDNVIGMVLFLAFNEYMAEDYEESRRHMDACDYMVGLKGGHRFLGLGGFLSQLIVWFKEELSLAGQASIKGKGKGKK